MRSAGYSRRTYHIVSCAELDAAFSRFGLLHEIIVYTAERYALLIFYVASEARRTAAVTTSQAARDGNRHGNSAGGGMERV